MREEITQSHLIPIVVGAPKYDPLNEKGGVNDILHHEAYILGIVARRDINLHFGNDFGTLMGFRCLLDITNLITDTLDGWSPDVKS